MQSVILLHNLLITLLSGQREEVKKEFIFFEQGPECYPSNNRWINMAHVPVKLEKIVIQTKVSKYLSRYWCRKDECHNFCRKIFAEVLNKNVCKMTRFLLLIYTTKRLKKKGPLIDTNIRKLMTFRGKVISWIRNWFKSRTQR